MKIYTKDRRTPVAIFDDFRELDGLTPGDTFNYTVCRNEYFVVQLLLCDCAGTYEITSIGMEDRVTVYNTQGVDKYGVPFSKLYETTLDRINPVYIGVDFDGLHPGAYQIKMEFKGAQHAETLLQFTVTEEQVENHGYNDLWRLSRLNWLNSTRALNDDVIAPFLPITIAGKELSILGRKVTLDSALQIQQVESYFDESVKLCDTVQAMLLSGPSVFRAEGQIFHFGQITVDNRGAEADLFVNGESSQLRMEVKLTVRCEGNFEYFVKVTAKEACSTQFFFNVPFSAYAAKYNYGMGKYGGLFQDVNTKWNAHRHDSMYVGNINTGAMIRLKAEHYTTPLVNVYYKNLPITKPVDTWDNHGRGILAIQRYRDGALFEANTGTMNLEQGEERLFRYEFFVTPYKPIDYKKHYAIRYYHSNNMKGQEYKHLKKACDLGLNYINVHHGNELHPYINYPFIEVERLKRFVQEAAEKGIGVKVYYTAREMSNHTAEVFCYKSFGNEIILQKKGQGLDTFNKREWLDKYFGENVIQAWQVHYRSGAHKGDHDIAFIIQPDSRIENYYIEGLQWLVDHIGIKGIYIDDTSLDAVTLRRAKKVLSQVDGLIDMHTWNHEEERAGDAACVNIYTDILPFVDSLWIGEGFDCNKLSPDYIFTEVSGLQYGNTSQMLEAGGNPYVGMLYAMNNRYGWGVFNADKIYEVWDSFGIQDAHMLGYWHSQCPVHTDNPNVLCTVYQKKGKALVAVYNFSDKSESFHYVIDEKKLGFPVSDLQIIQLKGREFLKNRKACVLAGSNRLPKRNGVLFILSK